MEAPAHILVIRLTAIGDVVLTLPAVSALRQNFPAAKITFLTTRENAALLQGFHDVDETITLDRAVFRSGNPWRIGRELIRLTRTLRAGKFSLVVDLQANGESAWLTRLTGARRRWGFVKKSLRRWAYTKTLGHPRLHPAEANCALLRHCELAVDAAKNEFFLPADAQAAARNFFAANQLVPNKPTLFIQPFTSAAHKNWPLENFLALAKHWQTRGWQIIFGGGPSDAPALEPALALGFTVSAGVPLLVTGGLMQLSALTLGGDTGALHLAVAQGKRVVMLMSSERPGRPHPFQHAEWALAPAVEQQGIASLELAAVIAACEAAGG
jgi:ADP-heptose:LPS heptosyltransferase